MSNCIICGKESKIDCYCIKKGMKIALCHDHINICLDCDVRKCRNKLFPKEIEI